MRSPEERLTRLLDRHPEFYPVGSDLPSGAIIRRREMLVPANHAGAVEEAARRWTDRRTDLEPLGLARFTMHRDTDVADLIATQFSPEGQDALAAPVHMFRGEPNYQGGPGDAPAPVADPPRAPAKASSAHAVTVAILDTGINAAHPWFPRSAWEAVDPDVDDRLDTDNDYELDSQAGHGTFIAGIARQHAPGAHLSISRVLGSDGVCDEVDLLEAINALRSRGAAGKNRIGVLNLSLGAYTWNDRPPALLSQAIQRLGADTVVVAAAGNNASDRVFWPAAFDSVVGVGAQKADGSGRTAFSNHGSWVDAWAPGERVASSFVRFDGPADEAPNADIDADCFTGFATWSGTSFAAPRIAAELARRAQDQKAPPRQVLRRSSPTSPRKGRARRQGPVARHDDYRDDVDSSDLADLVAGAAAGEQKCWDELVDRFAGLVWHVARSHRLGDADASDVAQTVWLRLVESLPRLREPAAVGGWLATTTRHECLRVLRITGREVPDDSAAMVEIPSQDASPEAIVELAEDRHRVRVALDRLSDRCRTLLHALAYSPDDSYAEVSAALGMPVGSIGPTRSRCLQHLRRELVSGDALAEGEGRR